MHIFVKLWSPKPSWLLLSQEQRLKFIKKAQLGMEPISKRGLETIGWIEIDKDDTIHSPKYQYCSVYKAADKSIMNEFHAAMNKFGWYEYFEQINTVGKIESPGSVLDRVLKLQK